MLDSFSHQYSLYWIVYSKMTFLYFAVVNLIYSHHFAVLLLAGIFLSSTALLPLACSRSISVDDKNWSRQEIKLAYRHYSTFIVRIVGSLVGGKLGS